MIINQYGLHWASGEIAFLVQQSGTTNMISPELGSPFKLKVKKTAVCPHQIDINQYVPLPEWTSDPLVDALAPRNKRRGEKHKVILDPTGDITLIVQDLTRLNSPTQSLLMPIWFRMLDGIRHTYAISNLSPMILISVGMAHMPELHRHVHLAEAFDRRLLIVARERLPLFQNFEWITTKLTDVRNEPLEAIGSAWLRKEMSNGRQ